MMRAVECDHRINLGNGFHEITMYFLVNHGEVEIGNGFSQLNARILKFLFFASLFKIGYQICICVLKKILDILFPTF